MTVRLALLTGLALALVACAGDPAPRAATAVPTGDIVSARFRPVLGRIQGLQRSDDAAALAGVDALVEEGIALLGARVPHDLARPDVPRFLEAREAFGAALKSVTYARDAHDLTALRQALLRLEGATRRWSDAHLGLAAESTL
jgi:hypothetical protein